MSQDTRPERTGFLKAPPRRRDWYRLVENRAADATELWIFAEIGPWFAVTARDFVQELQAITTGAITLHLHSPGGEIFDSLAIYRALLDHPARVTVQVDALAASSASLIAMAGDHIVMSRHARMMIHEPFGLVVGNSGDMRALAAELDSIGDEIASIYQERAGGTVAAWREAMRTETWYTDQQAIDAGLADELGPPATRITNHFDLSAFTRVPEELEHSYREPERQEWTERGIEHALRDAAVPRDLARAILARGWAGREAPPAPRPPAAPWERIRLEADLLELAVR